MTRPTRKQLILIVLGVIILAAIIYGFLPGAVPVETEAVKVAPFQVVVEEEGETYVKQTYVISSPVTAFLRRINLDPGDLVEEGDTLVVLEPPRSVIMDPRSRTEATARVEAARASLEQAESQVEYAISVQDRVERLASGESATQEKLEEARMQTDRALAARNAARAELDATLALVNTAKGPDQQAIEQVLTSPISGRILAVHKRSEGPAQIGEPLVEVGNLGELEVRVDVLSQDAVRIVQGMRVLLDQWGGEQSLEATVARVESQGKVEVSALGVEERRVQVIAEFQSPPEMRTGLGSGYRVLARFLIWEEDQVLQVPNSAIFRTEQGWGVFVVENEEAMQRKISIGRQSGLSAQVLEGLSEGETVIVHPDEAIEDGAKVEVDGK